MQIFKKACQSQENFSRSSNKLRLSYRVALSLVAKKMIVFVALDLDHVYKHNIAPRGVFPRNFEPVYAARFYKS